MYIQVSVVNEKIFRKISARFNLPLSSSIRALLGEQKRLKKRDLRLAISRGKLRNDGL